VSIVLKSGSLKFLEPSGSIEASRGTAFSCESVVIVAVTVVTVVVTVAIICMTVEHSIAQ